MEKEKKKSRKDFYFEQKKMPLWKSFHLKILATFCKIMYKEKCVKSMYSMTMYYPKKRHAVQELY